MKGDCCQEPLAGPVINALALSNVWISLGGLVRGDWPERLSLASTDRLKTLLALDDVLAGIYMVVDVDGSLRWLGTAQRHGGIGARLREHLMHPERARVYAGVYAFQAYEFSRPGALAAAEGKAADLLKLRGVMGTRTWPSSAGWPTQVIAPRQREGG